MYPIFSLFAKLGLCGPDHLRRVPSIQSLMIFVLGNDLYARKLSFMLQANVKHVGIVRIPQRTQVLFSDAFRIEIRPAKLRAIKLSLKTSLGILKTLHAR